MYEVKIYQRRLFLFQLDVFIVVFKVFHHYFSCAIDSRYSNCCSLDILNYLQAETVEDVDEWKDALERALQAAPNASALSSSPSFQTEGLESIDGSSEQGGHSTS
jgi:hypothetical protein